MIVCEDCGSQIADSWVGWPLRKEGPYRFCLMCTLHSVKNRGAVRYWEASGPKPDLEDDAPELTEEFFKNAKPRSST